VENVQTTQSFCWIRTDALSVGTRERILGYESAEIIGQLGSFYPKIREGEDKKELRTAEGRALNAGTSVGGTLSGPVVS